MSFSEGKPPRSSPRQIALTLKALGPKPWVHTYCWSCRRKDPVSVEDLNRCAGLSLKDRSILRDCPGEVIVYARKKLHAFRTAAQYFGIDARGLLAAAAQLEVKLAGHVEHVVLNEGEPTERVARRLVLLEGSEANVIDNRKTR